MLITREISLPIRKYKGMDHRWRGEDNGLIWCWERGRIMAESDPELSRRALSGELMVLGWRGGVAKQLLQPKTDGTLNYLAQWQGLRGDDLNIETDQVFTLTCSTTGTKIYYSRGKDDLG